MALFFLSYDLRGKRDYKTLYDKLKELSAVRILESQWCFNRSNTSAKGLREYFQKLIDADDGLCVSEVSDWSTWNTDGNTNELK